MPNTNPIPQPTIDPTPGRPQWLIPAPVEFAMPLDLLLSEEDLGVAYDKY